MRIGDLQRMLAYAWTVQRPALTGAACGRRDAHAPGSAAAGIYEAGTGGSV